MRILGIDPGTRVAGFGLVDVAGPKVTAVTLGVWRFSESKALPTRLAQLLLYFRQLVQEYQPTHLAIESAFVAENVRSALFLGHARGVVLAEAEILQLHITEIAPTAVKKALTNYGRAEKSAVAEMIGRILKFDTKGMPFDATDAMAIAYTSAFIIQQQSNNLHPVMLDWAKSIRKGKRAFK